MSLGVIAIFIRFIRVLCFEMPIVTLSKLWGTVTDGVITPLKVRYNQEANFSSHSNIIKYTGAVITCNLRLLFCKSCKSINHPLNEPRSLNRTLYDSLRFTNGTHTFSNKKPFQ